MKKPLVSIVIPVYNKVSFIRETLEAALSQTYQEIEIVLIDDGSTDGSYIVLKEYYERNPDKIVLVGQENQGVSAANNKALEIARGEYIQFLDADDLLSPNKIEKQVNLLGDKGTFAMASCEWLTFVNNPENHQKWRLNIFKDYSNPMEMLFDLYNNGEMMQPGVYLCSKELIEKAGTWNEKLTINQDGEFFMRVLLQAEQILFEPESKVYYRKPGQMNVSQQKSYSASKSLLESYRCYESEFLKKENSQKVREALAKNYLRFIYVTYPKYPDLIRDAEKEFDKFKFSNRVRIGGPKFQMMTKLLGFKNAIRLKRFL